MKQLVLAFLVVISFMSCESPQRTQYVRQEVVYRIEVNGSTSKDVNISTDIDGVNKSEKSTLPWMYTFNTVMSLTEEGTSDTYYPDVNWSSVTVTSNDESPITIRYYRNNELLMETTSVCAYDYEGNFIVNICVMVHVMVGPVI